MNIRNRVSVLWHMCYMW